MVFVCWLQYSFNLAPHSAHLLVVCGLSVPVSTPCAFFCFNSVLSVFYFVNVAFIASSNVSVIFSLL